MNLVTRQRGAAPEPARPAKPDKPRQPPAPAPAPAPVRGPVASTVAVAAPGRGSRMLKGVLRVVVPIGAMVVTYYVTNKVAGSALAAQFQGMPPQMIPMLISMAVGGITRQITK
jgi:hypothetical protein